jgi:drug/metabolite transporter (DMT)-like permease
MSFTPFELILCIVAVTSSSISQLCIKVASSQIKTFLGLLTLGVAGLLMLFSMLVAMWLLRTVQLSQLMPFAAGAYVLVPIGSYLFFKDHLKPRFWIGVVSIMIGITLTVL